MEKQKVEKGRPIFREGESGDAAYIIDSGRVEITRGAAGAGVRLATLGPGELFGEMAIIDGAPRMANATALENCVLTAIPRRALAAKIAKNDTVVQTLIRILVTNLRGVHELYVRRPRSCHDSVKALEFNAGHLRRYMEIVPDRALAADVLPQLDAIDAAIAALKNRLAGHADKRSNAFQESDLQVPSPRATK